MTTLQVSYSRLPSSISQHYNLKRRIWNEQLPKLRSRRSLDMARVCMLAILGD
jgi:hypothetical protein